MTHKPVETDIQGSPGRVAGSALAQRLAHFKTQPLYAIYYLLSLIFIWSAIWFFADAWATGQGLTAATELRSLRIPLRHLALAIGGLTLLSLEDASLQILVTMKTPPVLGAADSRQELFNNLRQRFPHLSSLYTIVSLALCWCGTWGLVLDIPVRPWLRSLLTFFLGLLMLYIDSQVDTLKSTVSEDRE